MTGEESGEIKPFRARMADAGPLQSERALLSPDVGEAFAQCASGSAGAELRGEPGSHDAAPAVNDTDTLPTEVGAGADNRAVNISRTGEAA